jgi:hypothetical protein
MMVKTENHEKVCVALRYKNERMRFGAEPSQAMRKRTGDDR